MANLSARPATWISRSLPATTIPDEDAQSITNVGQAIAYTNRRIQETRS